MAFKLAALVLAVAAAASASPSRIVDGTPVAIEDVPYTVAFTYYYPAANVTVQRCAGAILSSYHVITSAFCFTGAELENMKVRAGSTYSLSGGEVREIAEVIKHPDYVETPRAADIAIVLLASPLFVSDTIGTLYIPPQGQYLPDTTEMKVVSWGFESEDGTQLEQLNTVNLVKVPLEECQELYSDVEDVVIDDPVICAGDEGQQGICAGDSGAPMVVGQVAVGVASFYKGCGDAAYPDVFTRVDRYTQWILEVATAPGRSVASATASAVVTSPVVY